MTLFSERYGYTKPSTILIRERITTQIQNAICSCYDRLSATFYNSNLYSGTREYENLEKYLWTYFLCRREGDFYNGRSHYIVATEYISNDKVEWYYKLNMVESSIKYLYNLDSLHDRRHYVSNSFVNDLNSEFKRLNFAYRVVNQEIVEITSDEEIKSIEVAMKDSKDNIRKHLDNALKLYAQRPVPDFSNSIKESISAVEAYIRERTGEKTLGEGLNKLESKNISIHPVLKNSFIKLYAYTNQSGVGIRHALMDSDNTYVPKAEEALFMLVSCSAFINYLRKK